MIIEKVQKYQNQALLTRSRPRQTCFLNNFGNYDAFNSISTKIRVIKFLKKA